MIRVSKEDAGMRLDKWIKKHFPSLPFSMVQRLVRSGNVRINGKRAKADVRLEAGMEVRTPQTLERSDPKPKATKSPSPHVAEWGKKLREAVLFENAELIVLNKPAGLAVQGGSKIAISVDSLSSFLQGSSEERPRLVHRLDKDTSGVFVLAKTRQSAGWLTEAFRRHQIRKYYWAVVVGIPAPLNGTIDIPLQKALFADAKERVREDADGKYAKTLYEVKEINGEHQLAWVEMEPVTGRMHQLRVHMAAIGCPIVGDGKYGSDVSRIPFLSPSLHLHAARVVIPVPDGKAITVNAPLPIHMKESWKRLSF